MAAGFVQSNQLSEVGGSAGSQAPVQRAVVQEPSLAEGVAQVADTIDTLGSIYAGNKAKSLVDQEIENIDTARAVAEKGEFGPADDVPDSVKLDQKEWDILSSAVSNGEMSREKARLLASSRLRSRISEEPFFADRMRKAASGVLGFNIESEGARQYFASFKPQSQLGDGQNEYLSGVNQKASAMAAYLGGDTEFYRKQFLQRDANKVLKENLDTRLEVQGIERNKFASERARIDDQEAFGDIIGELGMIEATGEAVDNVVLENEIRLRKEVFLSDLRDQYVKNEGDLNSEEWARVEKAADERYDGYFELINAFGVDNLKQVKLDRLVRARETYGEEFFSNVLLIKDVYGEEGLSSWFELMADNTNETQRAQLFKQFPQLRQIDAVMRSGPEELDKVLANVSTKLLTNGDLADEDDAAVDVSAQQNYDRGNEQQQDSVIETLKNNNMPYKSASLIATKPPRETSVNNVKAMKQEYEQLLPDTLQQIGAIIAESESLEPYTKTDGTMGVKLSYPDTGSRTGAGVRVTSRSRRADLNRLEEVNALLENVDTFYSALKNNWGPELGVTKDQLNAQVMRDVEQFVATERNAITNQKFQRNQTSFKKAVKNGDIDEARGVYNLMREARPELFSVPFETLYDNMRSNAIAEE